MKTNDIIKELEKLYVNEGHLVDKTINRSSPDITNISFCFMFRENDSAIHDGVIEKISNIIPCNKALFNIEVAREEYSKLLIGAKIVTIVVPYREAT